jgi:hypothetical protein
VPQKFPKDAIARAALRGIAGAVPVAGSGLSEVVGFLTPDRAAEDRTRWEGEITARLNQLAAASGSPNILRDSFAWRLALYTNEKDIAANGEISIDDDELKGQFPEISISELDDALTDLKNANWIECWPDANSRTGVGGFNAKARLFAHTDPVARHTSPVDDAKIAAEFILSDPDAEAVSSVMLEDHLQWENRRLYPALAFLVSEVFPKDSVETYYHPQYPFSWVYLNGNSRRALREFLA